MMRYSIEPRDPIHMKGYRFLSFAINMGKSSGKYGLKVSMDKSFLTTQKELATDALKTS